jgi:uncharacterized protein involved in cysteine biosynthesis
MTTTTPAVSLYEEIGGRAALHAAVDGQPLALGLGLPAALLCMIPLLAIVVMPAAFAGGVLVALDVLGLARSGKARQAVVPFN